MGILIKVGTWGAIFLGGMLARDQFEKWYKKREEIVKRKNKTHPIPKAEVRDFVYIVSYLVKEAFKMVNEEKNKRKIKKTAK